MVQLACGNIANTHVDQARRWSRVGLFLLLLCGLGWQGAPRSGGEARRQERSPMIRQAQPDDDLSEATQRSIQMLEIFTICWFFVLGAVVGSFLNVVIYRLPLNMNLSRPPSRCSDCGKPIEMRDNIPVVSWLRLRGQCRNCQSPISIRYPLVETAIGLLFLVLCLTELVSGGANLPVRTINGYAGVIWVVWYTKWDLVGLYLYHLYLLVTLFCAAFIRWDGHPIPVRLLRIPFLLGIILPTVWPELRPVPLSQPPLAWIEQLRWTVQMADPIFSAGALRVGVHLSGLITGLAGLCVGAMCGAVAAIPLLRHSNTDTPRRDDLFKEMVCIAALCGLYLGWQAVVTIAVVVLPVLLALKVARLPNQRIPLIVMFTVTLIHHLCWRTIATSTWASWLYGLQWLPKPIT